MSAKNSHGRWKLHASCRSAGIEKSRVALEDNALDRFPAKLLSFLAISACLRRATKTGADHSKQND
jgi:hypothetical protein